MNKILTIVVAIVAFVAVSQAVKFGFREYRKQSNSPVTQEQIIKDFLKLNEQTPIQQTENIVITEVKADDNVLIMIASISGYDYDFMDVGKFGASQRITNLFWVCNNEEMQFLLSRDLSIRYSYSSPNGKKLFDNQISNDDCLPFNVKTASSFGDFYIDLQKKLLPMTLDSETVLLDVKRDSYTIELVYELNNFLKEEVDLDLLSDFFSATVRPGTCSAPDFKILFAKGFSIKQIYLDRVGDVVGSYQITKDMCETYKF